MAFSAMVLVLGSAFLHATWNLLAKRAGDGGAVFVWLCASLSAVLYAPLVAALMLIARPQIGGLEIAFMVGSGVIHLGYFVLLQRGYGVGDLSLVYPLARGTGPLLATVAAVLLFDERPSVVAFCGMLLIVIGVFTLTREPRGSRTDLGSISAGTVYGVLTGIFIAAYTLWDKHAVSVLLISPLLYDWSSNLVRAVLMTPVAYLRWSKVRLVWDNYRREVLGVAVLTPLAYIMVLTALTYTPVSYVAPLRETSILIATVMGASLLSEGDLLRRLPAAAAIVAGVVALILG